eukprot:5854340-Prymnesium_polylepis.1
MNSGRTKSRRPKRKAPLGYRLQPYRSAGNSRRRNRKAVPVGCSVRLLTGPVSGPIELSVVFMHHGLK